MIFQSKVYASKNIVKCVKIIDIWNRRWKCYIDSYNWKILLIDASLRKGPKKGLVYTTGTRKMKLHMHILQATAGLWSTPVVIGTHEIHVVKGTHEIHVVIRTHEINVGIKIREFHILHVTARLWSTPVVIETHEIDVSIKIHKLRILQATARLWSTPSCYKGLIKSMSSKVLINICSHRDSWNPYALLRGQHFWQTRI